MQKQQIRDFINELGNAISIRAVEKEIQGVNGILFSISGPTSITEVHITRDEAEVLNQMIASLLNVGKESL